MASTLRTAAPRMHPAHRLLGAIGRGTRARTSFTLRLAALTWGVVREGAQPATWRRTVRARFHASLTRVVAGSLGTVAATAAVLGLGLVFEALFWLRTAGLEAQIGPVLNFILIRRTVPLLVGIILLGRGGMATVAELGMLQAEGEIAILRAEGIDIFLYIVLPQAMAFALSAFTLGVVFVAVALFGGFVAGSLAGVVNQSVFAFLDTVLRALSIADLAVFPVKLLLIGMTVALTACLTGLGARETDTPSTLLPRAFTRGMLTVFVVTLAASAIL